jgi:hypothetical protein
MNERPGMWRRVWWEVGHLTWAEWALIVTVLGLAIWLVRR